MSQDLFAAFGNDESTVDVEQQLPNKQASHSLQVDVTGQRWLSEHSAVNARQQIIEPVNGLNQAETTDDPVVDHEDDDDFGDFEGASVSTSLPELKAGQPVSATLEARSPQARPVEDIEASPPKVPPKPTTKPLPFKPKPKNEKVGQHPFAGHMDLLFEAGDDEYDAGADELADLATNPEAAMAYSKRIIAEQEAAQAKRSTASAKKIVMFRGPPSTAGSNAPIPRPAPAAKPVPAPKTIPTTDSDRPRQPGPNKLKKKSGYVPAKDPDVLFDADNISDDNEDGLDDFGDFEQTAGPTAVAILPIAQPKSSQNGPQEMIPAFEILGPEAGFPSLIGNKARGSMSFPARKKSQSGGTAARNVSSAQQDQHLQTEDDAWDDFEVVAPLEHPPAQAVILPPSNSTHTRSASDISTRDENLLPPTNIPPPSVILSLFPSLFASADDALFTTMGKLDLKQRQILLAHPASHQFLKGYIGHCTVLAHIIAGRKLRWKRDQHLSQSMRIGPAAAGGKGGMKLTGVDKSETAKEDREVLDTVRLYKAQVGKLRTAVTAASSAPGMPKLPAVPDIAEQMPVKVLKAAEGGITAPHACALCGLKREERVLRVDGEIEDSFGEWWVHGMNMHLSCKNYWEEFEKKLKSR